jgi:sporulation protein YlmC with PRC-barrel domain
MDPRLGRAVTLAAACGCLALYGNTLAQQQSGEAQQQKEQQQQPKEQQQKEQKQKSGEAAGGSTAQTQKQKKDAPVAGRMKLGTTVIEAEAIAKGYRASRLIGAEVKNEQGERIGEIEDMVVSPDGKVTMAVIEVGGFLGIGDRRVAIPMQQFSSLAADNVVLPGATKTALRKLPEFEYARA